MKAIPAFLDHLVLATPELDATVAEFTRRTGVAPTPGGAHVGLGTRNHLVGLGGRAYLEIIGPDPPSSPATPGHAPSTSTGSPRRARSPGRSPRRTWTRRWRAHGPTGTTRATLSR